jgi:prophage antirepressor-like protein
MTSSEKLIEILRENNVKISNKGNICLNDFVNNIIESKNSKLYIKKLIGYDKILINNKHYISPDDCIDILNKTNFKKCKNIYSKIQIIDEDDVESIIDVENQIFQFEGHKFLSFFVNKDDGDWDVFLKGSQVADYLGYSNPPEAINDNVDEDNIVKYEELSKLYQLSPQLGIKNINKKTIFINLSGFFNLIHMSKKLFAKKIKKWLDSDVLPALVKYGTYTMQPKNLKIDYFYDKATFSNYDKQAVLYIGYVGKYKGEYIFKYGLSRDMFRRDYKEHRKSFNSFKVIFIGKCDNCEFVESLFEKELKLRNLHRELEINGKTHTEFFTITTKYTHNYFIDLLKELIDDNKLAIVKDAHNKIFNLTNAVDQFIQSDKLRSLELQFRLSDNYKLEIERDVKIKEADVKIKEADVKMKELETETEITVKNLDIVLQREKNKQTAMEKGYDLSCLNSSNTKNNSGMTKTNKSNILVL